MSEGRFNEWQREQGWNEAPLNIVCVRKNPEGISMAYDGPMPEDGLAKLAQLGETLSVLFGMPVWFSPADAHYDQIILDTLRDSQPALAFMMEAGSIIDNGKNIHITFPNGVAESLFTNWGGTAKLKKLVCSLAEREITASVQAATPPKPDGPVAVPLESSAASSGRIGRAPDMTQAVPLSELPPSGPTVVYGRVFSREIRDGRDGARHWTWTITDETQALRLKLSERRGSLKLPDDTWPEGTWVVADGVLETDKYTEERVLRVKNGNATSPVPLLPASTSQRIELHAHTKMSAMDGLISPKDLFMGAKAASLTAVAITDHGVVQAYPESETWARSTGVKAVYGLEAYMVDTEVNPLSGPFDSRWQERPWVVVDVETTGLSPRSHQVIELGAVKILGGEVIESFHRIVRPTRGVSEESLTITGITKEELAQGIEEPHLWQNFFQFSDQCVIVAHNARFDVGFFRQAWRRLNPGTPFDPLVLDTLSLARAIVTGSKGFGLASLTQYYKIPLPQHHRALADAEATGLLAIRLMRDVKAQYPEWTGASPLPIPHTVNRPVPVMLLVKSQSGLDHFYRLVSESHLSYFHRVPRVPRRLIEDGRQHWLVGSAFHGGEIADALFREASEDELQKLASFYDYWEVVPPKAATSLAAEAYLDGEHAVQSYLSDLVSWGRRANKWVVAVSDAHYLRSHHKIYRDIVAATAKGELHQRQDLLHLRTGDEMAEELAFFEPKDQQWVIYDAPEAIVNSLEDVEPVPTGLFSPKLSEAESVVSNVPYQKARELYGEELPALVQARLDREVESIVSNGFSSIYYTAHRLVQKSLDDGYLVGSRGSVGSSLVATLLKITEVNPLPPHYRCPACRYTEFIHDPGVGSGFDLKKKACPDCQTELIGDGQDIPFETFLGFEGDKVPDIDLNFSGEYQSEIHRYTEVLFGAGHVFRAGTIATVANKTAFGLVKAWARETGKDPTPAEIDWLASALTGVKRTTGQHPGGLMVVPEDEDIHHFCPVQHPADDRSSDVITTHFDYHSIEGRLLKLDLLGHDDPTAIRMLEDLTGVSAQAVPFQDAKTMSLFSGVSGLGLKPEDVGTSVGSLGIPEFGTRFVRQMLVDTRPASFADLVRISGLSHGTEVWTNNAQDLIRRGTATLSEVIATRDDIMTYLLTKGIPPKTTFTISEAVRKGKGLDADMERTMRQHGVPEWYLESCRHISYLFPKAHAAAYVMMGWRIAWFKVHYPLAYYATYFSVRAGDFDAKTVVGGLKKVNHALAAIEDKGQEASPKEKTLVTVLEVAREMLQRGFRFVPIDLSRSHATQFLVDDQSLIIPFAALPGLGVQAAQHIIEARQATSFLSIDDLRQRARLSKSIIELLREHGALSGLGETSQLGFF